MLIIETILKIFYDKTDRNLFVTVFGFAIVIVLFFLGSNQFNLVIRNIKWLGAMSDSALTTKLKAMSIDSALNPALCADAAGTVMFVNKRFEEVFGWKQEDIMNKDFSTYIMNKDMRAAHKKGMSEYFLNGRDVVVDNYKGVDLPAMRKDGSEFPVKLYVQRFEVEERIYFIGFMVDQTAIVSKQQQTKFLLDLYDNAEQLNKCCSWRLDILNNNTEGSPNFYRLYDVEKRAGNHRYGESVLNEDRPGLELLVKEAIDKCKDFETTYHVYHRQNGMQTMRVKGDVEQDENGKSKYVHGYSQVIETKQVL